MSKTIKSLNISVKDSKPQEVVRKSGRTPDNTKKSALKAMKVAIADIIMEEGLTALFIIEMM